MAVGPVQVLASNVDATNDVATVCTTGGQAVTLLQNQLPPARLAALAALAAVRRPAGPAAR